MAKILVIDDEQDVRFTLKQILVANGHEVVEAANGDDGQRHLAAEPTDVVVTDIIMPERESIETIGAIRRSFPEIKIIAISGGGRLGTMDILKAARMLGADEVLPKPFKIRYIVDLVARCLARRG